jgi:multisubunit Na+/H+ antiporter MnhE subunit
MKRLLAAAGLLLRFNRALLLSGWQTVRVIAHASGRDGSAPMPAFVRVRFAPMSETGAALLGCMVSLTPGTTTLDIDMDRYELLVHVLDGADVDGLIEGIRDDFEPGLLTLFSPNGDTA